MSVGMSPIAPLLLYPPPSWITGSCLRLTTTNLLQNLLLPLRASLRLPVLMEIHRKSLKPNQKNNAITSNKLLFIPLDAVARNS